MKTRLSFISFILFLGITFQVSAQVRPNTFLMNGDHLLETKIKINSGNEQCLAALKVLLNTVGAPLNRVPYTVVNKSITPPSGDKHDYMSLASYWWPNPNTSNGLPYIKKDGQTNPEVEKVKDGEYARGISRDVRLLGLSYYFTNDEKYAKKAAELLKVFFLNRDTRMNPNLKYAQIIRGDTKVYGTGTIDTEKFPDLIDGVQLLAGSPSWTAQNNEALKSWFNEYLNWLMTSEMGNAANIAPNNIGTMYDLQVVTYALYAENKTLAKSLLEKQTYKRMDDQLKANGEQPFELARTGSWTYSNKNLEGWFNLAICAENVGVNLWTYTTPNGKSLKKAFEFMLPYAAGSKAWPYQQIGTFKKEAFVSIARTGSSMYKDINLQPVLSSTHAKFIAGTDIDLLTSKYY
ncbi:alginate lyase family protein [Adhaeribacter swui]|uniref:Alginate lyase family protein n=1 Tax=Adhaeribacter swui TaxID=2086471 RepID=A0A7G7GBK0_9BACT|nr:alginate lyase family protein [Adhaeribacter swui]QNF34534.1 alginate lyase family protein [Adhaeribacter swui]